MIIEKPFGTDLASARELNRVVHAAFDERASSASTTSSARSRSTTSSRFRFANGMFEPVWNRDHIDYVQIDVPETLSIEGRAAFYEGTGAFRDMVVTHLFQVLGFVAMEPPTSLDAKALRVEKNKVFEAVKPLDPARVVRGQYEVYRREPGVSQRSSTETFVALEVQIDNWRWAGVPFFLRTGKCMPENPVAWTREWISLRPIHSGTRGHPYLYGLTPHGAVTILLSSVIAPLRASALPMSVAPVFSVIDCSDMMLPWNTEFVPSVAELPVCQKTFLA